MEPISWTSLLRRTIKEDVWRFSKEMEEKIKIIQDQAKGKIVIADEDVDKARESCQLVLYGKFFGRIPKLNLDDSDDIEHFFFNCDVVKQYWYMVERKLNLHFRFKNNWSEGKWLEEDVGFENESAEKLMAFLAIFWWYIWKNRNNMKFNEIV
ncbi:hypothetical protein Cni_G17463 [Canna indica]|uniref:Reverse transcriptase zinc-binding domain-containing protein n=1 Tax=Canna indica TaxID=4628 RepID=A0AAQ3KH26_9LILI|nr:hypothetical protein Cni_G17463 [Canna indica]